MHSSSGDGQMVTKGETKLDSDILLSASRGHLVPRDVRYELTYKFRSDQN